MDGVLAKMRIVLRVQQVKRREARELGAISCAKKIITKTCYKLLINKINSSKNYINYSYPAKIQYFLLV